MNETMWSTRARHRIAGKRIVVVGIGVDQMRGFIACGADVVGAISVVPRGGPPAVLSENFDVLSLESDTRDILQHVVSAYADALEAAAAEVAAFLDCVDPDRTAFIAGYLPLPHAVLGGRDAWIADSAIARELERKTGMTGALADAVPVIASIPLPPDDPVEWWYDTCAQLGADRLVVQRAGLSGGGTGTYVCATAADVATGLDGFVSPFVEGRACNVMGVVDDAGRTLVFPASRQLIRIDAIGHPLYSGNVTGERWAGDEREPISDEVRAIGATLATHGFFGPFGVDFIVTPDGRRLYHDLNPRMNGVVDSFARLLSEAGGRVPLTPALLCRPRWEPDELELFEADLHEAAAQDPMARLWLTTVVERAMVVAAVPTAGLWHIDLDGPCVEPVDATSPVAGMGNGLAELQPLLPPGMQLASGDRLALGNLYCDPELGDALSELMDPALIDAFLA